MCEACGGVWHNRETAIAALRKDIEESPELQAEIIRELAGKNLACWCRRNEQSCHADVLLEYAAKAGKE
jgi:hypothetical protein